MNSDMIFESVETLANHYVDLSLKLAELAASMPAAQPSEIAKKKLVQRLSKDCFFVNPDTGDQGGEAKRLLKDVLDDILKANPEKETEVLLNQAIEAFTTSAKESDKFTSRFEDGEIPAGGTNRVPGFGEPTSAQIDKDTLEVTSCRNQFVELHEYIRRQLRDFKELQDKSGFTKQFDIRGIRGSVDNLSAYPILTSPVDFAPNGRSTSTSAGTPSSLDRTVSGAIREVLGRTLKPSDTRSFLVSLNQSFEAVTVEGRVEYSWNPRSFAGQTDLGGGVTGGQASLYLRAKVAQKNSQPLLEGLFPLREDADPELIKASRSIVRSEVDEVVQELGVEGGPRIARVDGIFDLLFTQPFDVGKTDSAGEPDLIKGHINLLKHELGLEASFVNTLDEEVNLTNFVAFGDYVESIRIGWESFKKDFFGKDLGTRFVLLSRALSVVAESVREVYDAMDSVFVGPAERQVASFRDATGRRMLVSELLSWISDFASVEAPRLVLDGGRRGTQTIIPTAVDLRRLVERLLRAINSEADLPDGMRQPRVQFPLRELRSYLEQVERLATEVKRPATVA